VRAQAHHAVLRVVRRVVLTVVRAVLGVVHAAMDCVRGVVRGPVLGVVRRVVVPVVRAVVVVVAGTVWRGGDEERRGERGEGLQSMHNSLNRSHHILPPMYWSDRSCRKYAAIAFAATVPFNDT